MWSSDVLSRGGGLPPHELIRLLMLATDRSRTEVILGFDVSDDLVDRFDHYVRRRLSDEPLQYIEGSVPFGPVDLMVDDRVLVPRPETEYMFSCAAEAVEQPSVIVDLCCGSGNLALALASTFPRARTYATDLSVAACEVARLNAVRNDMTIDVLAGDLFDPLPESLAGSIDLLITNPPYLGRDELDDLPPDVREEPSMAFIGGERGDETVERIAADAARWLSPGGSIYCEISEFEAERCLAYFAHLGGVVHADLSGKPRFVVGKRNL